MPIDFQISKSCQSQNLNPVTNEVNDDSANTNLNANTYQILAARIY